VLYHDLGSPELSMASFVSDDADDSTNNDINKNNSTENTSSLNTSPLWKLFDSCELAFRNSLGLGQITEEAYAEYISRMEILLAKVNNAGLFSKNEEFEDISTGSLKYLYLNYYLGKIYLLGQSTDSRIRKYRLEGSRSALCSYLTVLESLQILREKSIGENEKPLSAEERRQKKIADYKRDRDAQQRIQALEARLKADKGKRNSSREDEDVNDGDDEEEARELHLLRLQSYGYDATKEIALIDEELSLIEMRLSMETAVRAGAPPGMASTQGSEGPALAHGLGDSSYGPAPGSGTGLQVTRLNKVGGQIIVSREEVRSSVFRDRIPPPTLSLEEYADRQVAEATERAVREQEAEKSAVRKYRDLEAAGLEDDSALVDQATIKDRDWDTFKEDNPRGWGNKMGKRF